jgi:hypothetical protein
VSKIIIPQSDVKLGEDPNVDITCKVIIRLHWKNKVVIPAVESMRKQLQAAFNDQAKAIEKDLIAIIKERKSPGYVKEEKDGSTDGSNM